MYKRQAQTPHAAASAVNAAVCGPDLHYLEIISDKLEPHQKGRHVNTILDERGLRFKLDCDV